MKTDNMYAFPGRQPSFIGNQEMEVPTPGLTKREYFAAMAMQGLAKHWFEIHDKENNTVGVNATVNLAVLMADELLKQLENETEI